MTLNMKLLLSAASVAAAVTWGATMASAQCSDQFAAAKQQNSQIAQAGPLGDADRRDPHSDRFADKDSNFWVAERDPANARFAQANPDARDPHASRFAQGNPDARDPHNSRFADKDSNFWVAERDPANARFAQANPDARDPHDSAIRAGQSGRARPAQLSGSPSQTRMRAIRMIPDLRPAAGHHSPGRSRTAAAADYASRGVKLAGGP